MVISLLMFKKYIYYILNYNKIKHLYNTLYTLKNAALKEVIKKFYRTSCQQN